MNLCILSQASSDNDTHTSCQRASCSLLSLRTWLASPPTGTPQRCGIGLGVQGRLPWNVSLWPCRQSWVVRSRRPSAPKVLQLWLDLTRLQVQMSLPIWLELRILSFLKQGRPLACSSAICAPSTSWVCSFCQNRRFLNEHDTPYAPLKVSTSHFPFCCQKDPHSRAVHQRSLPHQ